MWYSFLVGILALAAIVVPPVGVLEPVDNWIGILSSDFGDAAVVNISGTATNKAQDSLWVGRSKIEDVTVTTTVETNVVHWSNEVVEPADEWFIYLPRPNVVTKEATERTETTTVTEVTTLRFLWDGDPQTLVRTKQLSCTTRRFVKKEQWLEVL